jgi:hypothetical protein
LRSPREWLPKIERADLKRSLGWETFLGAEGARAMRTYDYRCKSCDETFSLILTDAQHDELTRSLREHKPVLSPSWEPPSCGRCTAAELESVPLAASRRAERDF